MRRNFKIDGVKYNVVNRFTGNCEINDFNPRYDVMKFSEYYSAWVRVASCMTISEGREIAESAVMC